ncbi:MAG: hypothetical protein K2X44_11045, partial [Magnetospirillum sp.]|nr:hypothetical protein [Magnetospirillum sp.]
MLRQITLEIIARPPDHDTMVGQETASGNNQTGSAFLPIPISARLCRDFTVAQEGCEGAILGFDMIL